MRKRDPTAFQGVAARLTHLIGRKEGAPSSDASRAEDESCGKQSSRPFTNAAPTQIWNKWPLGSSFDLEAPIDLFPHYVLLWAFLWVAARALIGSSDVGLSVNLLVGFLFLAFVIGRDSHGIGPLVESSRSPQGTRANKFKQRRVESKRKSTQQLGPLEEGDGGSKLKASLATSDESDDGTDSDDDRTSATTGAGTNVADDRAWEAFANCTTIGPLVPFGVGPPLTRPEEFEAAVALNGGNKWSEPPGDLFFCRGLHYLQDKQKVGVETVLELRRQ